MTTEYVLVSSGETAARSILKDVAFRIDGDNVVIPLDEWVKKAVERATMIMTEKRREIWNSLHYVGPTEKGVWLAGAVPIDITRGGGTPVWRGRYVHISEASYFQLRSQYFTWWTRTRVCVGWSHDTPRQADWLPANEPTPSEMIAYKALVDKYCSADKQGLDATVIIADIHRRSSRCDRGMKLFNLARGMKISNLTKV